MLDKQNMNFLRSNPLPLIRGMAGFAANSFQELHDARVVYAFEQMQGRFWDRSPFASSAGIDLKAPNVFARARATYFAQAILQKNSNPPVVQHLARQEAGLIASLSRDPRLKGCLFLLGVALLVGAVIIISSRNDEMSNHFTR